MPHEVSWSSSDTLFLGLGVIVFHSSLQIGFLCCFPITECSDSTKPHSSVLQSTFYIILVIKPKTLYFLIISKINYFVRGYTPRDKLSFLILIS